jgi:uncharacterized protein YggE
MEDIVRSTLYFCLTLLGLSQSVIMAEDSIEEIPFLSVTGRAEVLVEPDQAIIQLGVRAEAGTAREAQSEINRTIEKILKSLEALGINANQIQTSELSLQPVYADARNRTYAGEPRTVGYSASYTLSVKTEELSEISSVIDQALEAGANQLRGVRFGLKDEEKARRDALREAVADARKRAEVMAKASGTQLLGILTIIENGAMVRPPMMARGTVMAAEVGGAPTPVMPGQVTIGAQVTVRYQISQD